MLSGTVVAVPASAAEPDSAAERYGWGQTIQLDNFYGDDLQSAVYEVDWARVYALG